MGIDMWNKCHFGLTGRAFYLGGDRDVGRHFDTTYCCRIFVVELYKRSSRLRRGEGIKYNLQLCLSHLTILIRTATYAFVDQRSHR